MSVVEGIKHHDPAAPEDPERPGLHRRPAEHALHGALLQPKPRPPARRVRLGGLDVAPRAWPALRHCRRRGLRARRARRRSTWRARSCGRRALPAAAGQAAGGARACLTSPRPWWRTPRGGRRLSSSTTAPTSRVMAGATGVHVGQDDLPADGRAARRRAGRDRRAVDPHRRADCGTALELPVTYLAVGPVFGTGTKATGYERDRARDRAPRRGRRWRREAPLVAIGGITLERAPACHRRGRDVGGRDLATCSPVTPRRARASSSAPRLAGVDSSAYIPSIINGFASLSCATVRAGNDHFVGGGMDSNLFKTKSIEQLVGDVEHGGRPSGAA